MSATADVTLEATDTGLRVTLPGFEGTLGELAAALRAERLAPRELPLLALVRAFLAHFERQARTDLERASDALPAVAQVVELKLRLLLPRPPKESEEDADAQAGEALRAVALLEELEEAIAFLRERRDERRLVVPARAPRPDLPRPRRPLRGGARRLAKAASGLRRGAYFEMAMERLTLAQAGERVWRALRECGRGLLQRLTPARDWGERTVLFAATLELVREGRARAHQAEPFGPIELERTAERPAAPDRASAADGG